MHHLRRRRLKVIIIAIAMLAIVSSLVMYALRQNINLFYTPSDLDFQNISHKKLIRLGGLVVSGSVKRESKSLKVYFKITDNKRVVDVVYEGVLPDLFREGQSIVTQGYLQKTNKFKAIEVLAKHDENYMPKDLKTVLIKNSQQRVNS